MKSFRIPSAFSLLVILSVPFIAEPWITSSANKYLLREKHGSVVDVKTGQGMPGVTLVAQWKSEGNGGAGAWENCQYEVVVETDRTGSYVLPDVSEHYSFERVWLRQLLARVLLFQPTEIHHDWHIMLFHEDYVDTKVPHLLQEMHEAGELRPQFVWDPPTIRDVQSSVELNSIRVEPEGLPVADLITDYHEKAIYMDAVCANSAALKQRFDSLKRQMRELVKKKLCEAPRNSGLSGPSLVALFLLLDDRRFEAALGAITGVSGDKWTENSQLSSENACRALTSGTNP